MSAGNFLKNGLRVSLSRIIADHRTLKLQEEFSTEWAVAILYRPVALVVAWALQGTPVTPLMVTLAGLLCLPAMALAALLMAPAAAMSCVVALALVFMVLDCADGSLARITNRTSSLGQYADAATDICYRVVFYGAAGWVLARHPAAAGSWVAAGGFALLLDVANAHIKDDAAAFSPIGPPAHF